MTTAVQVQYRRGTASQVAAFTGAAGELAVDTTNNRVVVQDGSTAGGWPLAGANRVAVSDANYTLAAAYNIIAYTAITAARIVTLPAAASYPSGTRLLIVDESGNCSTTKSITISRAGSDTVDGQTGAVIAMAYGFVALESNGSNAWTVVDQSAAAMPSPNGANANFAYIEQLITCSGATTAIPLGVTCIVMALSLRVVTAVTGCASITVNDNQNGNGHWGSGIGLSAGTTNAGVASPGPYYNGVTTLALAAVGGGASFTGGTMRVSALVMIVNPPTS